MLREACNHNGMHFILFYHITKQSDLHSKINVPVIIGPSVMRSIDATLFQERS